VHKIQWIRQSGPSRQRRRLLGAVAASGVLAATIGFGTIASATGNHHQTRAYITNLKTLERLERLATTKEKQHVRPRTTAIPQPALGTPVVIPTSASSFGAGAPPTAAAPATAAGTATAPATGTAPATATAAATAPAPQGQTRPSLTLLPSLGRFATTPTTPTTQPTPTPTSS